MLLLLCPGCFGLLAGGCVGDGGSGGLGTGQVMSLSATGPRILSCRYHCRCADRPTGSLWSCSLLQQVVTRGLSLVYTTPGWEDEAFLMLGIFLKWGAKKVNTSVRSCVLLRQRPHCIFLTSEQPDFRLQSYGTERPKQVQTLCDPLQVRCWCAFPSITGTVVVFVLA